MKLELNLIVSADKLLSLHEYYATDIMLSKCCRATKVHTSVINYGRKLLVDQPS